MCSLSRQLSFQRVREHPDYLSLLPSPLSLLVHSYVDVLDSSLFLLCESIVFILETVFRMDFFLPGFCSVVFVAICALIVKISWFSFSSCSCSSFGSLFCRSLIFISHPRLLSFLLLSQSFSSQFFSLPA